MIGLERGEPGIAGEEEVTPFGEAKRRHFVVDGQILPNIFHEGSAENRHSDVLGGRELLADSSGRAGGRRRGIGLILFDYYDAAAKIGLAEQEIGDGAADYAAADDGDIARFAHQPANR